MISLYEYPLLNDVYEPVEMKKYLEELKLDVIIGEVYNISELKENNGHIEKNFSNLQDA